MEERGQISAILIYSLMTPLGKSIVAHIWWPPNSVRKSKILDKIEHERKHYIAQNDQNGSKYVTVMKLCRFANSGNTDSSDFRLAL